MDMSFEPTNESYWMQTVLEAFRCAPSPEMLCPHELSVLKDRICVLGQRHLDGSTHRVEMRAPLPIVLEATLEPWNPSCSISFSTKGTQQVPYPVLVWPFDPVSRQTFSWPEELGLATLRHILRLLDRLANLAGYHADHRLAWWRFGLQREPGSMGELLPEEAFFIPAKAKVLLPPFHLSFPDVVTLFAPKGEVQAFIDVLQQPCVCRREDWPTIKAQEAVLLNALERQGLRSLHELLDMESLPACEKLLAEIEGTFRRSLYH